MAQVEVQTNETYLHEQALIRGAHLLAEYVPKVIPTGRAVLYQHTLGRICHLSFLKQRKGVLTLIEF